MSQDSVWGGTSPPYRDPYSRDDVVFYVGVESNGNIFCKLKNRRFHPDQVNQELASLWCVN
jgi:hypothetical protein